LGNLCESSHGGEVALGWVVASELGREGLQNQDIILAMFLLHIAKIATPGFLPSLQARFFRASDDFGEVANRG
jgi:hypothetical protein